MVVPSLSFITCLIIFKKKTPAIQNIINHCNQKYEFVIYSFCLWGETPMYTIGAVRNAELALTIYPGWVCRYYCGTSVPTDIIDQLQSFSNTEVIMMEE